MNTQTTLKQWLFNTPVFFTITSFLLTCIMAMISMLFNENSVATVQFYGLLILVAFILSAVWTIRRMPANKLDRSSFVTLFNTTRILMLISVLLFTTIAGALNTVNAFTIVTAFILLFGLLYSIGLSITCTWAEFLRIRTMNIPLWKIICSVPFGFDMLWIPGYFTPNKADKKPIITTKANWISRLTDWTFTRPANAILLFIALCVMPGLFNATFSLLLTASYLITFAIWLTKTGDKNFIKNIGGTYATTAVIINFVIITCAISTMILF